VSPATGPCEHSAPRGPEPPRVPATGPCGQRSEAATCLAGAYEAEGTKLPRGTPPAIALNAIDPACPAVTVRQDGL
jgi:hypothetical protein